MFVTQKYSTVISRQNPLFLFIFKTNSHSNSIHTFKNPKHQTLNNLLDPKSCSSMAHLKQIHAQIIVNGLAAETLTISKLIAFCALSDSGDLRHAHKMFDEFPDPNKFMFNTLIRGFSTRDEPEKGLELYRRMVARSDLSPNEFTVPFVLKACLAVSGFRDCLAVHCQAVKMGIESRVCVQNALINVYVVCGYVRFARRVFDEMSERNIVSWNTMIGGFSKLGLRGEAFLVFKEMRDSRVFFDKFTLVSLISVCSQCCDLDSGRVLHLFVVISGVKIDRRVRNSLLDMYAKCGDFRSAQRVFDRMFDKDVVSWTSMVSGFAKNGQIESAEEVFKAMPVKNVVSWNAMLSCYVREGRFKEALELFRAMQSSNTIPDETTLVSILSACSQIGDFTVGKELHNYIKDNNVSLSVTLSNSLIDMYVKCGSLETAKTLFLSAPRRNLVSWNVMIGGLASHGHGLEATERFEEMRASNVQPDKFTFVGLLSACSHSGLVKPGRFYFHEMTKIYEITPEREHYACVVDLLGRGGLLKEAILVINEMPMRPDVVIWGALLGACRIHGNVEIGKQILKQVLELGPQSPGLYVLLSNLFSEAEKWEDVEKLRRVMRNCGVIKRKAISLIEVNGCVCEFMADDKTHQLSSPIYELLDQLTDHLRPILESWDCVY